MPFEIHLFISYTHIDNQPLIEGQKGWVDRFQFSLASLLERWMGEKAHIWKDERLAADDNFAAQIISQFPKTAVMLSVVSPRYIKSKWCKEEVNKFCEIAQQTIGLEVKNKLRLVRVVLAPVDRSELPYKDMEKALGIEFFEVGNDQTPREYDPYFGAEWGEKFLGAVQKLAFQLSELLKLIAQAEAEAGKAPVGALTGTPAETLAQTLSGAAVTAASVPSKPTVYLAECSYDQRSARDSLDVELKRHGYRVLPEQDLSRDEEAYKTQVAERLKQCQLSIHLVGSNYGMVPDGPSLKSVVVLQNELAIQQSRDSGLKRLIWVPESIAPTQKEQIDFVNLLKTNAEAIFGADMITSREPESIKGEMHNALQSLEQAKPPAAESKSAQDDRKMIFLICDDKDLMSTVPLNKLLKARGFDVKVPLFKGDAAAVRQARIDLLAQASGVLVFYGVGSDQWKASIDAELQKHLGGQSEKPIYTCLAGPETDTKNYLIATEEPNVLNCLPGITEDALLPFLAALGGVRP